jgi:dimethylhistidine N-methyltransferase
MNRREPLRRSEAAGERRAETGSSLSASEVREHLRRTPRQLPSRYFYDALGSALFEAICRLPWYGVTRAESALLARHAREILAPADGFARLVELGSGSGLKLAALLESADAHARDVAVDLVDVSPSALEVASRTVAAAGVTRITSYERSYEHGLREALARAADGPTLVLFLGSNIGNFDHSTADAFLRQTRAAMSDGDSLLLGADLVKPEADLRLAYDDPIGVTAAFNRNLLHRVNRELDADFRVDRFAHRAVWNAAASRIEMHLVSLDRQVVHVRGASLSFTLEAGEAIWTESSYKYTPSDLVTRLERAGFSVAAQWIDQRDRFALTMASAGAGRTRRSLRTVGPSTAPRTGPSTAPRTGTRARPPAVKGEK